MPTMNVNLTDALADFVRLEVERGTYQNASECVRDALRLLKRDQELYEAKVEAFREAIAVGLDQAERGEFSDRTVEEIAGEVFQEWEAEQELALDRVRKGKSSAAAARDEG